MYLLKKENDVILYAAFIVCTLKVDQIKNWEKTMLI